VVIGVGTRFRRTFRLSLVGAVLIAFGGSASIGETSRAASPTAKMTSTATTAGVSPLVGTWRRVNSCEAYVRALKEARLGGLVREALVSSGYVKQGRKIDLAHPCRGAKEVEHSHFFTKKGGFGSYDENGAQVDDGDYRVVDDNTLTFPSHAKEFGHKITVDYRIEGKTLRFDVVVPDPCTGKCRGATAWAIAAFYPGRFDRVN
jgi:hypothetical protein